MSSLLCFYCVVTSASVDSLLISAVQQVQQLQHKGWYFYLRCLKSNTNCRLKSHCIIIYLAKLLTTSPETISNQRTWRNLSLGTLNAKRQMEQFSTAHQNHITTGYHQIFLLRV